MIRGLLFAACAAALMGCAMESGEDETSTAPGVEESTDTASMAMDRGYMRPSLHANDTDRCGSPRHRVENPNALPTSLTHVPTPVQMGTNVTR